MKSPIPLKLKKVIPKEPTERLLIYGVHPDDIREPKKVYCFWCSSFLQQQLPCIGDIINVSSMRRRTNGEMGKFNSQLCITDVQEWKEGDFEPRGIAVALYKGHNYRDFEYNESDGFDLLD